MSIERKYGDAEVREILRRASREGAGESAAAGDGWSLTLAEIQGIAAEVGLDPAAVTRAAAAVEAETGGEPRRTYLGVPIAVGRVVPLPRAPTDIEWERLVAELRTTFGARGRVSAFGGSREWANGNLHAYVEPTASGYRLRLGTLKSGVREGMLIGGTALVAGAATLGSVLLSHGAIGDLLMPWAVSAAGAVLLFGNWLRLPRWAAERERQMAQVASAASALLALEGPDAGGAS